MVCFETKEEANPAIQDLNETTRYVDKEYKRFKSQESKKQRKNQSEGKEQKSNKLNAVTTENIAQTTQ